MVEKTDPNSSRHALLVLGMHRSGTSALTRVLSLLGAELPSTLLPANEYNEAGYWESDPITNLQDELLARAGTSWLDPAPFPASFYGSDDEAEFQRRLAAAIEEEFNDAELFVIKDPRISRIVPFWTGVLRSLGIQPHFIIAHRHPLEVAASLERRDSLLTPHSLSLWLRHTLEAEAGTRGLSRVFVAFEALLDDWRGTSEMIGEILDISWPRGLEEAEVEITSFLSESLRHHRSVPEDLAVGRPGELLDWVKRTYEALTAAREDRLAILDGVRAEVAEADSSGQAVKVLDVGLLLALTEEIGTLRQTVRDAASELERVTGEHRGEIEAIEARHSREITDQALEHERLTSELERQWCSRVETVEQEKKEQFSALEREKSAQIARLQQQHEQRLEVLRAEREESLESAHALEKSLVQAEEDFEALSNLQSAARQELIELSQTVAEYRASLDGVLSSKSWKLTKPLRDSIELIRAGKAVLPWLMVKPLRKLRPRLRSLPEGVKRPLRGLADKVQVEPAQPIVTQDVPGTLVENEPLGEELAGALPWIAEELGPGPHFEEEIPSDAPGTDIKLIAFYLPQYHPFPENDRFWGRGFTEWMNTAKAQPEFQGHFQPRLPGELGHYDLRVKDVQRRQIELAQQHGIHGFCYHHYWFSGRPIMRLPFNQVLEDPSLDFPFCLHWANEPWTSSWDGLPGSKVLLDQEHTAEDDLAFIQDIEPALKDPRYIRIQDKPLLLVYRPGLFPDIRATVDRWQEHCLQAGIGELYLAVMQQGFDGQTDPRDFGFDAAVEFPPHNVPIVDARAAVELHDPDYPGYILSYPHMVKGSLETPVPDYKLFRGLTPAWDCTARRREATVFVGSTPDLYQEWLEGLCRVTRKCLPAGERLVFINAWNEWAEGAYLEPDQKYGYAFLNRTGAALGKTGAAVHPPLRKLVVFGHDAARAGAQILLLDLLRWLTERTATEVRVVLREGGELLDRYRDFGEVLVLSELRGSKLSQEEIEKRIQEFSGRGVDLIYANTAATGRELPLFESLGAPIITHVHELEESLQKFCGQEAVDNVIRLSSRIITASPAVAKNLHARHGVGTDQLEAIYAFIEAGNQPPSEKTRERVRQELGLNSSTVAVFGCGTRDWRKAPDIFVDVAERLVQQGVKGIRFFWIGAPMPGEYDDLEGSLAKRGLEDVVSFTGPLSNPRDYFAAGDIFLLSSREDPFPLVCLEAADCQMPTVCFADAGGMPDFVEDDGGYVVPHGDVEAMTEVVARLVADREERTTLGNRARDKLLERHTVDVAMPEILQVIREVSNTPPAVSVILPNYNYAHYMPKRVESILGQTFQDFELLIEDDCSTDDSVEVLSRYASRRNVRLTAHAENRGAFTMWLEGLKAARSELVWIAEADDLCEPQLLERLLPFFEDEQVNLAYAQSYVIDEKGDVQGDYALCFPDLSSTKWLKSYVNNGRAEMADGLAIKNTILNASAVVFRKPRIELMEKVLRDFKLSGDWYLYLNILQDGRIGYCAEKLNYHRRHEGSIIAKHGDKGVALAELGRIHGFLLERHDFSPSLIEKMVGYAVEMWQKEFSGADLEDFWNRYGLDLPESTKRSVQLHLVGNSVVRTS